jgi:hypothetical protein
MSPNVNKMSQSDQELTLHAWDFPVDFLFGGATQVGVVYRLRFGENGVAPPLTIAIVMELRSRKAR